MLFFQLRRSLNSRFLANLAEHCRISTCWSRRYCSHSDLTPSARRLEGKVALVTGGASGIGAAAARIFAAQGARVVVADVQDKLGAGIEAELTSTVAKYVHCDVKSEADVAAAVDVAASLDGHLDVVFANAGIIGALGPLDQTRGDELAATVDVNLKGTFFTIKHSARVMKPLRSGAIVVTGSIVSCVGGLGPHVYTMCKTGLLGLVRSAAVELRDYGIRINMVSPDAVPTQLLASAFGTIRGEDMNVEQALETVRQMSLLPGRLLKPDDIAAAVLFLASEEAGYISGHNLVVDASNTVTKPADMHNFFTTYCPMIREAGKRGV